MKKVLLTVLFALSAFSQMAFAELYHTVYEDQEYGEPLPPPPPPPPPEPISFDNSIFVNVTAGYGLIGMYGFYDDVELSFESTGMVMDVNFGLNIKRLFAIYAGAGFKVGSGDWEDFDDGKDPIDIKETGYNVVGLAYYLGVCVYPFREKRWLKGMFGAIEVGNINYDVYRSRKKVMSNPVNTDFYSLRLKYGYVFDVSRHISLGLTTYLELSDVGSVTEYKEDEVKDASAYSLGVMFTFMRR